MSSGTPLGRLPWREDSITDTAHQTRILVISPEACSTRWKSLSDLLTHPSPVGGVVVNLVGVDDLDLQQLTAVDVLIVDGSPCRADMIRRFSSATTIIVCSDEPAAPSAGMIVVSTDVTIAQVAGIVQGAALSQGVITSMRRTAETAAIEATSATRTVDELVTELDTAARIQAAFNATTLPALKSCRLGCLWQPADRLSGDVYEVSTHADRWITLFLADVVGHGLGPALMTMMIRQSIAACQRDRSGVPCPSELMRSINSMLLNRTGEETHFATAVCAVVDTQTSSASLAGAGHPAALIRSRNGSSRRIPSRGALLGVFADDSFPASTIVLNPGDHLMLYSDGFEQVLGAGTDGVDAALLTSASQRDPEAVIEHLQGRIDQVTGRHGQEDDLTLLCLGLDPVGGVGQTPQESGQSEVA